MNGKLGVHRTTRGRGMSGLVFILLSGAIITESIYAWPGVGRLAIESIHNLDAPIIMGIVIMVSFTVQLGNFLADVAVGALDPRVRVDEK